MASLSRSPTLHPFLSFLENDKKSVSQVLDINDAIALEPGTSKYLLTKAFTSPKRSFARLILRSFGCIETTRKLKKIHFQSLISISVNSGSKKSSASPDPSCGHLELTYAARFAVQIL